VRETIVGKRGCDREVQLRRATFNLKSFKPSRKKGASLGDDEGRAIDARDEKGVACQDFERRSPYDKSATIFCQGETRSERGELARKTLATQGTSNQKYNQVGVKEEPSGFAQGE